MSNAALNVVLSGKVGTTLRQVGGNSVLIFSLSEQEDMVSSLVLVVVSSGAIVNS